MSAIVVGVDPGATTGITALSCGQGHQRNQVQPFALQVFGSALVVPIVETILDRWPVAKPLLAVEQFVVSMRAARSATAFAGRLTRELVAQLQCLEIDHARGLAVDVVVRPAATVKPWATDVRLEKAGLLEPTKGMGHARDAARHALYAAVHAQILDDPLSAKRVAQ